MAITTRLFGKSGPLVTQMGLDGEGVLRSHNLTYALCAHGQLYLSGCNRLGHKSSGSE